MSTTTLGSVVPRAVPSPPGSAGPRRLISLLLAAMFGLILAISPLPAPKADAAVPASARITALRVALSMRGVAYRYGGTSPRTGFDCSGLTQYAYARVGRYIPRTAQQQYNATIRATWRGVLPGDLVLFYSGHTIYHVGIYVGSGYMVDAPHTGARVRVEKIWSSQIAFGRVR